MIEFGPKLDCVGRLSVAAKVAGIELGQRTALIAVQHLVATNVTLFESLFRLGLDPARTFVLGKGYSSSQDTVNTLKVLGATVLPNTAPVSPGHFSSFMENDLIELWRMAADRLADIRVDRLIVLDDGGRSITLAKRGSIGARSIVGVEQTTSGIRRIEASPLCVPVIDVARSAAKLDYESPLIAETVIKKLKIAGRPLTPELTVGVVGLGSIGRALVSRLHARGINVLTSELPGFVRASESMTPLTELFTRSDILFGCTGSDLFSENEIPSQYKPGLILCSCSSEDLEFLRLIKGLSPSAPVGWPAPNIEFMGPSGPITIMRGGYPINFDSTEESVTSQDIQLTTALVLAGILTAAVSHDLPHGTVQLPTSLQAAILSDWFDVAPIVNQMSGEFRIPASTEWLQKRSSGHSMSNNPLLDRVAKEMSVASAKHHESPRSRHTTEQRYV